MRKVFAIITARLLPPYILGFFVLLYIGIAFQSDEALVATMALMKRTPLLFVLLALVPLNLLARLLIETRCFIRRRKAMLGTTASSTEELFDEQVKIPGDTIAAEVQRWLQSAGYRTVAVDGKLAAWRGVSSFPARFLFMLGSVALFAGVILSLSGRETVTEALISGEPLPPLVHGAGTVQKIELREQPQGVVLARDLSVSVTRADGSLRQFGMYPPGRIGNWFVYPRFLGLAPLIRFSAPDLLPGIESYSILMIHPAGKEDALVIPNSPYRLVFSLADTDGTDPYVTGMFTFLVRVEKMGSPSIVLTVPAGDQVNQDGYQLAIPEVKRMVHADFVSDTGVPLIWCSCILFAISLVSYLPIRLFNPRRDILFCVNSGEMLACSRAEGRLRRHSGVFHESVDILAQSNG